MLIPSSTKWFLKSWKSKQTVIMHSYISQMHIYVCDFIFKAAWKIRYGVISDGHSRPCLSRKKCQALIPGRFGICPCGERSPCSACPPRTPISLFPRHGRGPCHKTHLPAGSTALPALWFAVNREGGGTEWRGMAIQRKGRWQRKRERVLGNSVLPDGHNRLLPNIITATQ